MIDKLGASTTDGLGGLCGTLLLRSILTPCPHFVVSPLCRQPTTQLKLIPSSKYYPQTTCCLALLFMVVKPNRVQTGLRRGASSGGTSCGASSPAGGRDRFRLCLNSALLFGSSALASDGGLREHLRRGPLTSRGKSRLHRHRLGFAEAGHYCSGPVYWHLTQPVHVVLAAALNTRAQPCFLQEHL